MHIDTGDDRDDRPRPHRPSGGRTDGGRESPAPGGLATAGGLRLRSPVEIVTAVPYLLGFHPRDSLVMVSVVGRQIGLVSRIDIPPRAEAAEVARQLAAVLVGQGCDEVVVVVVGGGRPRAGSGTRSDGRSDGRPDARPGGPIGGRRPPRPDLVAAARSAFDALGVPLSSAVWVPRVAAGAVWWCYDSGARGVLPDPAASAVAAATVAAGHVTYPGREDLERLVAPDAPAAVERRSRRLDALCDRRCASPDPDLAADAFALVQGWVQRAGADPADDLAEVLDDEAVVALCMALSDPIVRDAAFGFGSGPLAAGAERLWTALVRQSPDPESAEAAVLLAHSALVRGNGALVGIALDRALRAWPGHRMGELFRSALDGGLGPDDLLGWFAEGAAEARRLLRRPGG